MMARHFMNHVVFLSHVILLYVLIQSCDAGETSEVPTFTTHPVSQVIKQHGKVTLECSANPANARISWIYEGPNERRTMESDPVLGIEIEDARLRILSFRHTKRDLGDTHEGLYMCVASSETASVLSQAAILERAFMGQFSPDLEDIYINATQGNTALIPCDPPKGTPPPRVIFELNDGVIDFNSNRHMVMPSGNLQIKNVKQSDEGVYRCVTINTASGQRRVAPNSIHFKVITPTTNTPPRFVMKPRAKYEVIQGQNLTLECVVQGSPVPHILWEKHSGELPLKRHEQVWGNLILYDVQVLDQGTYICRAENQVGPPTADIAEVQVIEPPSIRIPPADQIAIEGATVAFQCVARGRNVQIEWVYNSRPILTHANVDISESSLTITRVRKDQAGVYQCIAKSKLGHVSSPAHLQVKGQGEIDFVWPDISDIPVPPGMASEENPADTNPTSNPLIPTPDMAPTDGDGSRGRGRHRDRNLGDGDDYDALPPSHDDMVPPNPPEVSKQTETSALLRWSVPQNKGLTISFFKIQYREIDALSREERRWQTDDEMIDTSMRQHVVRRLNPGSTYKFRVMAVFTNLDNNWSENSRKFELEANNPDRPATPRTQPIIVELRSLATNNLALSWQYQTQDISAIDGFIVYVKPYGTSDSYQQYSVMGAASRNFNIQQLKPNTHYSVQIASFNAAGQGPVSIDVVEKTLGPADDVDPMEPFPDSPDGWPGIHTTTRRSVGFIPPNRTNTADNSTTLYIVLAALLGIMLMVLFIFMFLCWRKQRKHRRRMEHGSDAAKFGDPSKTIYADSLRKTQINGGPHFLLSELNGINNGGIRNGNLSNGHVRTGFGAPASVTSNPLHDYDETVLGFPQQNGEYQSEQELDHLRASLQEAFHPSAAPVPPERGVPNYPYSATEYARHPHNYYEVDPNSDTLPRVSMSTFGCRDCKHGSRPQSRADNPYSNASNPPPEYNSLNVRNHSNRFSGEYPEYTGSLRKPKTNPHVGYDSGYRASPDHIPRAHERPPFRAYEPYGRAGVSGTSQRQYDPYSGSQDTAYGSQEQSANMSDVYEQLGSEKSFSSTSQAGRPKHRRKSNKKPRNPINEQGVEISGGENSSHSALPPRLSMSPAETPADSRETPPQLPPRNTPPVLAMGLCSPLSPINQFRNTPPPLIKDKPTPASRTKNLQRQGSFPSDTNEIIDGPSNGSADSHGQIDGPCSELSANDTASMSPQVSHVHDSDDHRALESDLDLEQVNVSDNEGFCTENMTDSHISSSVVEETGDEVENEETVPLFQPQLSQNCARVGQLGSPLSSPRAESQPLMQRNITRVNDYSDDDNEDS